MTASDRKVLVLVDGGSELSELLDLGTQSDLELFDLEHFLRSHEAGRQDPELILATPERCRLLASRHPEFRTALSTASLIAKLEIRDPDAYEEAIAAGARAVLPWPLPRSIEDRVEMLRSFAKRRRELHPSGQRQAEQIRRLKDQVQELRERYLVQSRYFNESQDVFYLDLARMMTIIDNIMDGIVFTDPEGKVTLLNPCAEEFLGIKAMVAIGKQIHALSGGTELMDAIRNDQKEASREGSGSSARTIEIHHSTQDLLYLSLCTTAVTDYKGSFAGVLTVIKDVTVEFKSDQMRNQYLSIVSHELRTPLTGIKTFATLLAGGTMGSLESRPRAAAESIRESTLRLEHEIDKLICLSTIETGDFALDLVEFEIRDVLDGITGPFDRTAKDRGIHIILEMPGLGLPVQGDRENLRRGIQALIENSVKFVQDGGNIDVFVVRNGDRLEIHVKDDGPGIDRRYQRRIFEMFYQVENPLTRHHGGAGLGLPLAQGVALAHDGRVELQSAPGEGADFWISLPLGSKAKGETKRDFEPVSVREEA